MGKWEQILDIHIQKPPYVTCLMSAMFLMHGEHIGPYSQFDHPDHGLQMMFVVQSELWYPQRTKMHLRTTGDWVRRPIWGPGVVNHLQGGPFELGNEREVLADEQIPLEMPPIKPEQRMPRFPRDMCCLVHMVFLVPYASCWPARFGFVMLDGMPQRPWLRLPPRLVVPLLTLIYCRNRP